VDRLRGGSSRGIASAGVDCSYRVRIGEKGGVRISVAPAAFGTARRGSPHSFSTAEAYARRCCANASVTVEKRLAVIEARGRRVVCVAATMSYRRVCVVFRFDPGNVCGESRAGAGANHASVTGDRVRE
jgi:hypothetical protein